MGQGRFYKSCLALSVPGHDDVTGRAVVLRIEPPAASRPMRASIVPSLRSADAFGPALRSGPARSACMGSAFTAAVAV
ncbi:hypothetical protein DWU98_03515 [Dyella monticola]|uniref:Uncharacterized protein n=1 Tax=Dyella monticola TaxID=1927958 RepID=A0A370X9G9_9GAMM|nr:hypothetical protein DWU98_03515 [Dyella monticola]